MLAWNRGLFRPYESAWKLALRFCILNQPSGATFEELLFQDSNSRKSDIALHLDFANPDSSKYSSTKFSKVFGISRDEFKTLFLGNYGLLLFNGSKLGRMQYCRSCIAIGYHSPIHQSPSLRLCPIHKEPIESVCKNCGRVLSFQFSSHAPYHNYLCNCGAPLYDESNISQLCAPLSVESIAALDEFAECAATLARDPRQHSWVFDGAFHTENDRCAYGLFARATGMPTTFCDLFYSVEARVRRGFISNYSESGAVHSNTHRLVTHNTVAAERRNRTYLEELAGRVLSRINTLLVDRLLQSSTANDCASDAKALLEEHRRGFVIGNYSGTAYERWMHFWLISMVSSCARRTCSGAIRALVSDLVYTKIAVDEWPDFRGVQPLREPEVLWCIRKIFAAMFIYTYKWAIALRAAEREGLVRIPESNYLALNLWALPRFYLLLSKNNSGNLTLYCTHQDITSASFAHSLFENCNRRNQPLHEQILSLWANALRCVN